MARTPNKPPEKGTVFNMLTIVGNFRIVVINGKNKHVIDAICECGKLISHSMIDIKSGKKKSCGCLPLKLLAKMSTKTGLSKTKEYRAWTGCIKRCYDEKCAQYKNYGDRGISVSDRWRISIFNFIEDMGLCPDPKFSLDRVDNNGNYEKDNCRWASNSQQCNNRRSNLVFEYKGNRKTLTEISREVGIDYNILWSRLRLGFSIEKAISQKIKFKKIKP